MLVYPGNRKTFEVETHAVQREVSAIRARRRAWHIAACMIFAAVAGRVCMGDEPSARVRWVEVSPGVWVPIPTIGNDYIITDCRVRLYSVG